MQGAIIIIVSHTYILTNKLAYAVKIVFVRCKLKGKLDISNVWT